MAAAQDHAVRAALDYCREAYRAVGVITNGSVGPQQGKLRSLGLDRWAEAKLVFISDACGVMKPAPEIFRLAQTAAGGGPCVFVGDSCSQDIAGASACGWQTIWLSRTGESPTASQTLTAHADGCVGMAANMIGVLKRIIAVEAEDGYLVLFNPVILKKSGQYEAEEGCLSLEGVRKTKRWQSIKVQYQTMDGKPRIKTFTGWTAQIIQHEIDHCDGILI